MNEPILFDTSVWIDFLNKKSTPAANLLAHFIEEDMEVLLTPTILQEILQGIRDDYKYLQVKEMLSYFTMLDLPAVQAAIGASDLYRSLRKKGATVRKSNDCLIAFYALEFSCSMVHDDTDFDLISKHFDLQILKL
ncbi:PIN domain nuclease [Cyclobacterium sp.]|uniref:type II toxin-antitoxin system VapC family toxin n=1 Tax=Cyclobacterium sp. TaxID=1966343 RepID=UPI001997FDBE|nr:PIN domain nuclease [Cyclobacterium sp.]MBD3628450.1 PIN domain nuclease [Cyclobacterium sp.]